MSEYTVTQEDITTWRQTFPELVTWSDESVRKYASLFKKEFVQKPYSIERPIHEQHNRTEAAS